jgi:hypothetical protein
MLSLQPATTFPAKQMEKWKEELKKGQMEKLKWNYSPEEHYLQYKNMYDGVKDGVSRR